MPIRASTKPLEAHIRNEERRFTRSLMLFRARSSIVLPDQNTDSLATRGLTMALKNIFLAFVSVLSIAQAKPPHIVFFIADDLGWSDVGFNNPGVYTPTLNQFAEQGLLLNQSYVLPTCSPSRHALLTGRYPFRDGIQNLVFTDVHPKCVPLDLVMLPEKLKEAGYATHLVGKWHLGHCNDACTPTKRGFDSFYGFYGGQVQHFQHRRAGGLDFHDNSEVVRDKTGQYTTYLHADRAVKLIEKHDPEVPLFLYLAFDMPHYPVEAPDEYVERYTHVKDEARRQYLAMVTVLDEAIGKVTNALRSKNLFDDSIVVFMSDNGGQPKFAGTNYPLRGAKLTIYEGGTRSPTLVTGGAVHKQGYTHNGIFHVTDWFPTLMNAAGLSPEICEQHIDGLNQWDMINSGSPSQRKEFVYNLDIHPDIVLPYSGMAGLRYGRYKLMLGYGGSMDPGNNMEWIKPPEMCSEEQLLNEPECQYRGAVTGQTIQQLSENQRKKSIIARAHIGDMTPHLFDLELDPTERNDVAAQNPEVVQLMEEKLRAYMEEVALPLLPTPDPAKAQGIDGVHNTGWCSVEQLQQQRRESLAPVKNKHPVRDSCFKD